MALHFEITPRDEREMVRAGTTRKREAWKRETELERLLYSTADAVATTRDEFEDTVMVARALAADAPEKEARLRAPGGQTLLDKTGQRLQEVGGDCQVRVRGGGRSF